MFKLLTNLNTGKAMGPDSVGNKLLKEDAPGISAVLARIFNLSISLGQFPDTWKLAHVVPLHKKNEMTNPNNYRPVSLLPCVSKVFEKVVFAHVHQYLKSYAL